MIHSELYIACGGPLQLGVGLVSFIIRYIRNILLSLSIDTHCCSARVDGPLLEIHSFSTSRQPMGSQVLSAQRFYPPTTAFRKCICTNDMEETIPFSWLISNVLRNYIISTKFLFIILLFLLFASCD